jgi:hypothetical protein
MGAREDRKHPPAHPVPNGGQSKHCCVGVTRFNAAMQRQQLQPACKGVRVTVHQGKGTDQDRRAATKTDEPGACAPAVRPDVEAGAAVASDPATWDFVCYGISEWQVRVHDQCHHLEFLFAPLLTPPPHLPHIRRI